MSGLLNKHEVGVYCRAVAPAPVSTAECWRATEREGACEARRRRRRWGDECVCVCESRETERQRYNHGLGGKSILSAKDIERTEGVSSERRRRRKRR